MKGVSYDGCSSCIGADVITLDGVAGGDNVETDVIIAGYHVSGPGIRTANRIAGGICVDLDAVHRIAEVDGAGYVRAYVVTLHDIACGTAGDDCDTLHFIAGDDVAVGGRRSSHRIILRVYHETAGGVAQVRGTVGVCAQKIALDHVIPIGLQKDPVDSKPVDRQPLNCAAAGSDPQSVGHTGAGAIQLDNRCGGVVWLGSAVDDDWIGNCWKG